MRRLLYWRLSHSQGNIGLLCSVVECSDFAMIGLTTVQRSTGTILGAQDFSYKVDQALKQTMWCKTGLWATLLFLRGL